MKTPSVVKGVQMSFFRDFVDNSDLKLAKSLLTEDGRDAYNRVKFEVEGCLAKVVHKLPQERGERLLRMSMISHVVSQILYEIAKKEDRSSL